MKKLTDSKQLKLYLYSQVVVPLKDVIVDFTSINSPIKDKSGAMWFVEVSQEPMTERVRFNYQRDRQAQRPNSVILLRKDGSYERVLLAYYSKRGREVTLFEQGFKKADMPYLLNKFHEVFSENEPFSKVNIDHKRNGYAKLTMRIEQSNGAEYDRGYSYSEEEDEDDGDDGNW